MKKEQNSRKKSKLVSRGLEKQNVFVFLNIQGKIIPQTPEPFARDSGCFCDFITIFVAHFAIPLVALVLCVLHLTCVFFMEHLMTTSSCFHVSSNQAKIQSHCNILKKILCALVLNPSKIYCPTIWYAFSRVSPL